jgi:hypothetical protein
MYESTSSIYYFLKILKELFKQKLHEPELFPDLYFTDGRRGKKYKANMIRETLKRIIMRQTLHLINYTVNYHGNPKKKLCGMIFFMIIYK